MTVAARYVLLGDPTGHSPTPALWNRLFRAAGLSWTYTAHDVADADLERWFRRLRDGAVAGAHVTMPHKAAAAAAADVADERVHRTQVANWLTVDRGRLAASNTDAEGARLLLGARRFGSVLLLGSGGAARALADALEGRADRLTIVSVDGDGARAVGRQVAGWLPVVDVRPWQDRATLAADADLVINATPIGMDGDVSPAPVPAEAFTPETFLYDLVYRGDGSPTPLQDGARAGGAEVIDGLAHLEAQAVTCLPHIGLDGALSALIAPTLAELVGRAPARWSSA
jgi:shikimate dehydrogenase